MKYLSFIALSISCMVHGQVVLNADGLDNTYSLITSVLAPENNPIETPDCSHAEFGNHIDEIFDNELNQHVFRFHIHVNDDNDRCINFDRQRNEIKTYDKSPDNLLGAANETVIYKWKFKLNDGFQVSSNFTHLHQIKSVGGPYASMPMYTLTARKSTPDRLELRYAETDQQITLLQTDLNPFVNTWLEVTETIKYGTEGTYSIVIKKVSDDSILMSYSNDDINNWREDADFVRPKWGIYRSLINKQDLRDETLLFANIQIEETSSLSYHNTNQSVFDIITSSIDNILHIQNIPKNCDALKIYTLDGKNILDQKTNSFSEIKLNTTSITKGIYILQLQGNQKNISMLIPIHNE